MRPGRVRREGRVWMKVGLGVVDVLGVERAAIALGHVDDTAFFGLCHGAVGLARLLHQLGVAPEVQRLGERDGVLIEPAFEHAALFLVEQVAAAAQLRVDARVRHCVEALAVEGHHLFDYHLRGPADGCRQATRHVVVKLRTPGHRLIWIGQHLLGQRLAAGVGRFMFLSKVAHTGFLGAVARRTGLSPAYRGRRGRRRATDAGASSSRPSGKCT